MTHRWPAFLLACLLPVAATGGPADFSPGPLIRDYGPVAAVAGHRVDARAHFRVAFDVAKAAEHGAINRGLESAARFLNMHAAAGVPADRLSVAVVVHGPAAADLLADSDRSGANASAGLVAALIEAGASIELCGQTAAYRDIRADQLLPGVKMALSAMTAHARLQQQGYTLNPF